MDKVDRSVDAAAFVPVATAEGGVGTDGKDVCLFTEADARGVIEPDSEASIPAFVLGQKLVSFRTPAL